LALPELGLVLDSAAGDATFYHDVPLLHGLAIFAVVMALYVFFAHLFNKQPLIKQPLAGAPELISVESELTCLLSAGPASRAAASWIYARCGSVA
jgi:hypothetical protein